MAKTWKEKLDSPHKAHVSVIEKPMFGCPTGAKLFIAHPHLVKAWIEKIPFGKTRTVEALPALRMKALHGERHDTRHDARRLLGSERAFDLLYYLRVGRIDLRLESSDNPSISPDKELCKIPFDLPRERSSRFFVSQELI